jgi:hypothetical protein
VDYYAELEAMTTEEFEKLPPVKDPKTGKTKKGFDIGMIMIVVQAIASVVSALSSICKITPDPTNPEELIPIQRRRVSREIKRECREDGREYDPVMLKVGQKVALRSTTQQMKGLKKQLKLQGGF